MKTEELVKKAEETVKKNVCGDCNKCQSHGYIGCDVYKYSRDSFIAGAKELEQKIADINENWNDLVNDWVVDYKELEKENELLAKRICELQSDLSRLKSLNEKMKRCSNCVHRFVGHFSQVGTCQRSNCKNYSEWCFDGQFLEIEKEQEVKE